MYSDRYPSALQRQGLQRGLSIVEIMVAMVIAMVGVVIIFQMLASSEERKRSASSGSEVQVTGIISITALERDIREAGYGFSSAAYDKDPSGTAVTPVMGCTVNAYDFARPVKRFTFTLAPIQIAQGAGGASDSIIVLRGNGGKFPAAHIFTQSSDTTKKTRGRAGLSHRDMVLIANTTPECMLAEITAIDTNYSTCTSCVDGLSIQHIAADGQYTYPLLHPDGTTTTETRRARYTDPTPLLSFTDGFIFNLGNAAQRRIWTVTPAGGPNPGKLLLTNDLLYVDANSDGANDTIETGDNIVNLQAEYGIDANNNGQIDASEWTTTDPTVPAKWANVLAVRLAVLLRSPQFERPPTATTHVTTAIPNWTGGVNPDGTAKTGSALVVTNLDGSPSTAPPVSGKVDDDWRNYRYRVYETVIPLRNILWGSQIKP